MVTSLAPAVKSPDYVEVANFPCLYRHARSGRCHADKEVVGKRREHRSEAHAYKIAERHLRE